jgi:uncharacterized protein involved in response to NO
MMLQKSDARRAKPSTLETLTDEGLRLFFPLAAVHAALWPALWIFAFAFGLPLAQEMPPGLWHAREMLVGAYGAALIGFIVSAVPEWTDTPRPRGRVLLWLAAAWGTGRVVGLAGYDAMAAVAAAADLLWLGWLIGYVVRVSLMRRTDRLIGFTLWLAAFWLAVAGAQAGFVLADQELARSGLWLAGLAFLALLGLALSRIVPPVTNLILDPTGETAPYRPHPGRQNLAPGLIALGMLGELAGWSPQVSGFLLMAAGAAFLDRAGEAFIGRAFIRAELVALHGSAALAGAGLLALGAGRLGAPLMEAGGLHLALQGGLGLGVLAVFSIAGRLHTGRALGLTRMARAALMFLVASVAARAAAAHGWFPPGPVGPYGISTLLWAGAFGLWFAAYWPMLSRPRIGSGSEPGCR